MKKNIIYIQKDQIQAVQVKLGKKTAGIKKSTTYSLKEKDLEEIFALVRKSLGKDIRILLDSNLFSLYTFVLPAKSGEVKKAVEAKLTSLVSEKISDLAWDFQEIGQTSKAKIIQIAALQKDLLDKIITIAEKNDLEIEILEPLAYSLARLSEEKAPHLLLYPQGKKVLALAIDKRKVLNSITLAKPEKLEKLISFVKDNFVLEINKVILAEDVPEEFRSFCNQKKLAIETQNFNPTFGLALEFESLLSILPKKKEVDMSEDFAPRPEEVQKPAKKGKKVFLLFFFALVVIGTVFGVRKLPVFQPQASPSPSPTSKPVEEEIEVEPELERKDLSLKVLNGSGEKGVAGTAQEYLEELGYEDIEAGNADEFDYQYTQIEIKEDKEEYLDLLIEDLESEYSLATDSATLDEDSDFDAIIIIGE